MLERHVLQQMVLGKLNSYRLKKKERKKVDPSLTLHTKVTSNLIKHLTVSLDTLKILE